MTDGLGPVRWSGDQAITELPGQLDGSNAEQVRELLLSVIGRGAGTLIADLSASVSCDHAAAEALAEACQRAVAGRTELRLVVTSESVRRVLSRNGIDRLVPVYPSLEAAMTARAPGPAARPAARPAVSRAGTMIPLVRRGDLRTLSRPVTDSGEADFGTETALLDGDGVIESVNQAWLDFAAANGGDPARTGPGVSYLEVCAAAGDDPVAQLVAGAIRAALAGDLSGPLAVEVPCHSPAAERWYEVLISSRTGRGGRTLGAAVTLSLARSRPYSRLGAGLRLVPRPAAAPDGPEAVITARVTAAMIEAFSDGVALADHCGTLLMANRRLEEMFGYQHGELRGQPVEQLLPAHLQDAHRSHRAGYSRAPATRAMGAGACLVGQRRDGSTFPAEISLSPVQTATGQVITLVVVRDVTAARRLERLAAQAAEAVAAGGRDLLGDITDSLYHVGLSLRAAAELDDAAARAQIAEALTRLDATISQIRAAALASDGNLY
jgi:anti-anti-sigma factor